MSEATVTRFTRSGFPDFGREAAEELSEWAARHGLMVRYAGGALNDGDSHAMLKLKFSPRSTDYARDLALLGLPSDAIGRSFVSKRSTFTVRDLDMSELNGMPVYCVKANGKGAWFVASAVAEALAAQRR